MRYLLPSLFLLLLGCSSAPEAINAQATSKVVLAQYVVDMDKQLVEVLNGYEQAVKQHADYRYDVIVRSLEGKDAAKDVQIALGAAQERERMYREAREQRSLVLAHIGTIKLNLYDHEKLQEDLRAYLAASGISAESAGELTRMIAEEVVKRTSK